MSKDYFEAKLEGTTYWITKKSNGILRVFDIEVQPEVEKVWIGSAGGYDIRQFIINSDSSYPNVKELIIEDKVSNIQIPNSLFPNVKHILSASKNFVDNTNVLIGIVKFEERVLINTFCKHENDIIDLKGVKYISKNALKGCMCANIINADMVKFDEVNIYDGVLTVDEKTGAKLFGNILVQVNQSGEIAEIPDDRYDIRVSERVKFSNAIHSVKIHRYKTLKMLEGIPVPPKVIIESVEAEVSDECVMIPMDMKNSGFNYFKVNDDIYSSMDGILYTSDKKVLLGCPTARTGIIKIPEGVEIIAQNAFMDCEIETVIMPKSLICIEESAFYHCTELRKVILNHGLKMIEKSAFEGCKSLEDIVIPASVTSLETGCFKRCPLSSVIFPEGIEVIPETAFNRAGGVVHIPKSVKRVGSHNFSRMEKIYLKGDIPHGLLSAIMVNDYKTDTLVTEVKTPKGSLYLPKPYNNSIKNKIASLEKMPFEVISKKIPLFVDYVAERSRKEETALILYEKTGNEGVLSTLKQLNEAYASRLVAERKDDELIRLVKTNTLNKTQLYKILELTNKYVLPTVSGYILNKINELKNREGFEI